MVVLDLLGRRASLRILWELGGESLKFRDLQTACETNSRLLNTRLTELREMDLIAHDQAGYHLTNQGKQLRAALKPLSEWAQTFRSNGPI
jgi:DNA-binding HxlR family transcriptional regulator